MTKEIKQIIIKWVERGVDDPFKSAFYDMELRVFESTPKHPYYERGMRIGLQDLKEMAKDNIQVVLMP